MDLEYKDLNIKLKPGFRPPPPEVQEKLIRSFQESREMTERKLPCPVCSARIEGVFSDGTGHVNVKCRKCGFTGPLNLAYFRRRTQKECSFPFYPGGGCYRGIR